MNNILQSFARELDARRVRLHGAVLMAKDGRILEEIYRPPYTHDSKTRMYSSTKSVASVAIGKLIGEGKLSLDTKICDIFEGRFDMSQASPLLYEQTVRHTLMMSTVYPAPTYSEKFNDWTASYFRGTAARPAGMLWSYDSCGSYILGAIVKQITGKDFVQYLRPEFDVMGVSPDVFCLEGPDGEAWASSAFIASTSDLARIACLLLCHGRWGSRQLIPADYARDAITPQITNFERGKISPYACGYGYQIWGHPGGAFAFRGLGGQVAIGFPGRDFVFACNADTDGNETTYDDIFRAVENQILPSFPVTDEAVYREALRRADLTPAPGLAFDAIENKSYRMETNHLSIDSIRFAHKDGGYEFFYTRAGREFCLPFALDGELIADFPEAYNGKRLFSPDHRMTYRCSVECRRVEENKLLLRVWAEDLYVGNLTFVISFSGGRIAVAMTRHAQFFFDGFGGCIWGHAE